jgi:hypothetical protein
VAIKANETPWKRKITGCLRAEAVFGNRCGGDRVTQLYDHGVLVLLALLGVMVMFDKAHLLINSVMRQSLERLDDQPWEYSTPIFINASKEASS